MRIQFPDSSLIIDSPPVDPVCKVEGSVRPEVDSNSQNSGHRFNFRSQFEGGPIFFEGKGVERGVSARATERHDKEVLFPLLAQRSEEHTSELQSRGHLVCRLLLEKKKYTKNTYNTVSIHTILLTEQPSM